MAQDDEIRVTVHNHDQIIPIIGSAQFRYEPLDYRDLFFAYNLISEPPSQKLKIESEKYGREEDEENMCIICFEPYKKEDMVTTLSCRHVYHTKCLKEWGKHKAQCPTCRATIPIEHSFGSLIL